MPSQVGSRRVYGCNHARADVFGGDLRDELADRFPASAGEFPEQPAVATTEPQGDDPEWGRAFWTGSVAASCDHERRLRSVKTPVLLTLHFRHLDPDTGFLIGTLSDLQAARVRELLADRGVDVEYRSFDRMGHSMHDQDPGLFTETLVDWAHSLDR